MTQRSRGVLSFCFPSALPTSSPHLGHLSCSLRDQHFCVKQALKEGAASFTPGNRHGGLRSLVFVTPHLHISARSLQLRCHPRSFISLFAPLSPEPQKASCNFFSSHMRLCFAGSVNSLRGVTLVELLPEDCLAARSLNN